MLDVAPTERLRLGTTCIGATEDGQVLLEAADPVIPTWSSAPTGSARPCGGRCSERSHCATADIAPGERELASMTNLSVTASSRSGASAAASASARPGRVACTGTASRRCRKPRPSLPDHETSSSAATGAGSTDSGADRIDGQRRDRANVHVQPAAASHLGPRPRDAARRRRAPDEAEHRAGSGASARGRRCARLLPRRQRRTRDGPSLIRASARATRERRRPRLPSSRTCRRGPLPHWCASARCHHEGATRPPRGCTAATDR